jgi:hypothetical protein
MNPPPHPGFISPHQKTRSEGQPVYERGTGSPKGQPLTLPMPRMTAHALIVVCVREVGETHQSTGGWGGGGVGSSALLVCTVHVGQGPSQRGRSKSSKVIISEAITVRCSPSYNYRKELLASTGQSDNNKKR